MGFSEKSQVVEGGFDSSDGGNKKWVIAGITLRSPLKPVYTAEKGGGGDGTSDDECVTTPTGEESRIPQPSTCPPAPRKPKPPAARAFKCKFRRGANKFFNPPDLDTVFIHHVEKASLAS